VLCTSMRRQEARGVRQSLQRRRQPPLTTRPNPYGPSRVTSPEVLRVASRHSSDLLARLQQVKSVCQPACSKADGWCRVPVKCPVSKCTRYHVPDAKEPRRLRGVSAGQGEEGFAQPKVSVPAAKRTAMSTVRSDPRSGVRRERALSPLTYTVAGLSLQHEALTAHQVSPAVGPC